MYRRFDSTNHVNHADPADVLQAGLRVSPGVQQAALLKPGLIVAGATGPLGSEVLRRLAGGGRFAHTHVLTSEPIGTGMAQISLLQSGSGPISNWPDGPAAEVGVVMFEPPRLYYQRERALWTPEPAQLLELAQWFRRCGVDTLAIVVPHAQGRLPDALKQGLANLDEQAVSALGFNRLLLVRAAHKPAPAPGKGLLDRAAALVLSTMSYMLPATEQAVRPAKLAEFIEIALHLLPRGIHVASPELLWRASQSKSMLAAGDGPLVTGESGMHDLVRAWLGSAAPVGDQR